MIWPGARCNRGAGELRESSMRHLMLAGEIADRLGGRAASLGEHDRRASPPGR